MLTLTIFKILFWHFLEWVQVRIGKKLCLIWPEIKIIYVLINAAKDQVYFLKKSLLYYLFYILYNNNVIYNAEFIYIDFNLKFRN